MNDGPLLVVEEGGEVHRLYLDAAVFGRSKSCDLSFDRAGVSRRHCEIVLRADGALVRDLGSSHGTFLDDMRVHGEAPLARGQIVQLGPRGPRLRILDARVGTVVAPDDEATRPVGAGLVADDATRPIGAVPRTETAQAPPPPAHRPATVVADVPRRPPAAPPAAPGAPVAEASSFARDLVLGIVLGAAAGIVLLVLVDLAPLRSAVGLG